MNQEPRAKLVRELKKELVEFEKKVTVERVGTVIEVGDGVAQIHGLSDCFASEMLEFSASIHGVALNLLADRIGAVVLGDYEKIKEGDLVKGTGRSSKLESDLSSWAGSSTHCASRWMARDRSDLRPSIRSKRSRPGSSCANRSTGQCRPASRRLTA